MIDIPDETTKKKKIKNHPSDQRKQLVLNFIHEYRRVRRNQSPTYKEIAVGIGYAESAAGTVYTLVDELIDEGWVERIGGSRGLIPLREPTDVYCEITRRDLKAIGKRQHNLKILKRD